MARDTIGSIEELEALYGTPSEASLIKETDHLLPEYRTMIELSPFVTLATAGPEGLDCSPRGDQPGFVRAQDERTLLMPDRRGNNRADSLKNIVRDPRVALLFLLPGSGTTLRVNGRAHLSVAPELLASFAVEGAAPRSVIVIDVDRVYFQCARAILRSHLWEPERFLAAEQVPTAGQVLESASACAIDAHAYDAAWPERAARSLW